VLRTARRMDATLRELSNAIDATQDLD